MTIKTVATEEEKNLVFDIRKEVFVKEQGVSEEEEWDEHDQTAIHFIGYNEDQPVAASRLRFLDEYGKLERICVLKEARGKHFGKEIILKMEDIAKQKGYTKTKLNAQTHAEGFYKKLGYKTVSGEFLDAGIPHVTMVKELEA